MKSTKKILVFESNGKATICFNKGDGANKYLHRNLDSVSLNRINNEVYDMVSNGKYQCFPFLGLTIGYLVRPIGSR